MTGPIDVIVCAPATEDLCREELARACGVRKIGALTDGVLVVPHGTETAPLAFARQALPRARVLRAESPSALADAVVQALDDDDARAWLSGALVVDVSLPDVLKTRAPSAHARAHPLEEGASHIRALLAVKREGRARKQGVAPVEAGAAERRLELLITEPWVGALSASHARSSDALSA